MEYLLGMEIVAVILTPSFSMIEATPWTEDVSKVSIELSRCLISNNESTLLSLIRFWDIEG